jgi:hypothetical protein
MDELCACGCGYMLPPRPRYLKGHDLRLTDYTVEDRGYETPCWIPVKKPNTNGYVVFRWSTPDQRSTRIGAHCLAYIRAKGPIPKGHHVDHLCRVTACINPDHLEAVLPRENVRRTTQVKLNPTLVREIRASAETNAEIAARLSVSRNLIWQVRKRKLWADID